MAKAVEHALTSSRPKARYLVGADAKAGARFRFGSTITRSAVEILEALLKHSGSRRLRKRRPQQRRVEPDVVSGWNASQAS